jgi:uncharacterized spore protein YtfJ
MSAEDTVRTTVEELLKVLATKNVIGDPIELEDKILIPVTSMGMAFGAGKNEPVGQKGVGGAAGGGAGVTPVSVVVVFKGIKGPEGVKVLPLTAPSHMARTIGEIASAVMEKAKEKKEVKKEVEEKTEAKPGAE